MRCFQFHRASVSPSSQTEQRVVKLGLSWERKIRPAKCPCGVADTKVSVLTLAAAAHMPSSSLAYCSVASDPKVASCNAWHAQLCTMFRDWVKACKLQQFLQAQEKRALAEVAEHAESACVSPNWDPSVLPGVCYWSGTSHGGTDSWFLSFSFCFYASLSLTSFFHNTEMWCSLKEKFYTLESRQHLSSSWITHGSPATDPLSLLCSFQLFCRPKSIS